ncbi:hypothetical protein BDFB_005567 [Asbolus verrucosus]|uniref:Uncharacterized protein n=1 Tax=Asbolus verrucosus TaxID=1661398 RepID=A0A482WBC9_ASBVE|nr:hypothetical protein BDFB_005567 [Asbolus verrucosus]
MVVRIAVTALTRNASEINVQLNPSNAKLQVDVFRELVGAMELKTARQVKMKPIVKQPEKVVVLQIRSNVPMENVCQNMNSVTPL